MNEDIVQEILHELFSSLETLETQSSAVLQLLKDKGLASEQELALQLEKAGNASNVRWRAAQVRIDHLVSSALKTAEREAKQQPTKNQESPTNTGGQTSRTSQGEEEVRSEHQAPTQKSDDTSNKKNQSQQAKETENEGSGDDARKNAA